MLEYHMCPFEHLLWALFNKEEKSIKVSVNMLYLGFRNTYSFILQKWKDDSLRWEPTEYENATFVYLPPARVWRPNFGIANR